MKSACLVIVIASLCGSGHLVSGQDSESLWCSFEPVDAGQDTAKHIVLISGDEEYRSEEALPMLGKILSQRHGFKCSVLFAIDPKTGEIDPNNQQNIPGMHLLQDADLVIMALRFRSLPDDQMKYFDEYLMSGKPVIGLRTSTHAFRYKGDLETSFRNYSGTREWPGGFGKQVLGETWVNHHGHHGRESTRGIICDDQIDHLLLTGVTDIWGPTDVYGIRELPKGCTVLLKGQVIDGMQPDDKALQGDKNEPMMPLAWTRFWETPSGNKCPVFCTTMGSSTDFENEDLRRLIVNAALHMTGQNNRINDSLKVDYVGEYDPTDFGFNSFRKGMKPSDFQSDTNNR